MSTGSAEGDDEDDDEQTARAGDVGRKRELWAGE
jgi:hypothetical protein